MAELDRPTAKHLAGLTSTSLASACARSYWKDLVFTEKYSYRSELAEELRTEGRVEGHAQGMAEGQAVGLLEVLRARGVVVSDEAEKRIQDCTDSDTLTAWVRRAVTVDNADEIFD